MSVSEEVRGFIHASLAENNKSLLDQFSKLVAESAEGIKRSSVDAADEQLRALRRRGVRSRSPLNVEGTKFNISSTPSFRIVWMM